MRTAAIVALVNLVSSIELDKANYSTINEERLSYEGYMGFHGT